MVLHATARTHFLGPLASSVWSTVNYRAGVVAYYFCAQELFHHAKH